MNIVRNPLFRLGVTLVSLMVCIGLLRSIFSQLRGSDIVGERKESLLREEQKNRQLKDRLKEATSSAFVEKQAREKLGLAMPGDTIVLLGEVKPTVNTTQVISEEMAPNWKRWWRLFF
jgi:cell division protein FtsB